MPFQAKRTASQKSKWSSSCVVPSVEPLGVKTMPPEILMRERFKRADIMKYVAVPQFDFLPRVLIPRPRYPRRPPKMHYGWLIDEPKFMAYAEQHGCLRGPNAIEADEEAGEDAIEYEISPVPLRVDPVQSMSQMLRVIGDKLSPSRRSTLQLACAINVAVSCSPCIVSIYSNYDLAEVPPDEFIESLRIILGETEKPRWFVDDCEVTWRPWI